MPADSLSARQPIDITVEARAHGWRVDHYLSRLFPNYSRSLFQKAIEQDAVLVNGMPVRQSRRLRVNDRISVRLPEQPDERLVPEDLPLDVLYEDEALIVLNKAAGMITHPGRGNVRGTLAAAVQFHFDRLSDVAGQLRPGIVHRLDRDTTGVLVVAKDNQVHHRLSGQFERREVRKEYRALLWGLLDRDSDYVETHVRVHPKRRERMLVCPPGGNAREAITFYEVIERFEGGAGVRSQESGVGSQDSGFRIQDSGARKPKTLASQPSFTYARLLPRTGRTHQLRLHMEHLRHPIVADRMYGGRDALRRSDVDPRHPDEPLIARQALHAYRLEFRHPRSGQSMAFEAPLPEDFERTLQALRDAAAP